MLADYEGFGTGLACSFLFPFFVLIGIMLLIIWMVKAQRNWVAKNAIRQSFSLKTSTELREIVANTDSIRWPIQAVDVARELLLARGEDR